MMQILVLVTQLHIAMFPEKNMDLVTGPRRSNLGRPPYRQGRTVIEAQSGVKFNQANRESGYNSPYNQLSMRPHYTVTKTEYWFPVVKTKGMADASGFGTLNVILSRFLGSISVPTVN